MPRYKCIVEYDGSSFSGWQKQESVISVQQTIEDAIKAFCGETVTIYTAGRTDAGVHAAGQVIHFDLSHTQDPIRIMRAINYHIKSNPVAILSAQQVTDDFH